MRSLNKQYMEIQRLRGVAVLMVVFAHMEFLRVGSGLSRYFWNSASAGVDIFFVISGFVVGKTLFEHLLLQPGLSFLKELEANVAVLKAFFVRRIFRLFPAVLLVVVLNIAITVYMYSGHPFPKLAIREEIIGLLSYLSMQTDMDMIMMTVSGRNYRDISHFWTLAVEERFYLLMPFVILGCVGVRRFMKLALGIIIALTLIKMLPIPQHILQYNGFLRFDAFMIGILVYLINQHSEVFKQCFLKKHSGLGRLNFNVVTLLILVIAARLPMCQVIADSTVDFTSVGYYYLCIYILSAVLIVLAIQDNGYVLEIPGLRAILEWVGDRSYTIYIFQFFFRDLGNDIIEKMFGLTSDDTGHRKLQIAVFFAVMIIGSELIYRFWETPFREWGKRIAYRIKTAEISVNPSS